VLRQIEAHVDLLEQTLQPGKTVAGGSGDDSTRSTLGEELAVGQIRLIATQVHVHTGGAGDRP
jgi:hypothetical protein